MERILERYERYSSAERQFTSTDKQSQGSWTLEHAKLKARIELLQKIQRHFMGEELDSLSLKELQDLEQQLDMALKRLRFRKTQMMLDSISDLQKKDKALQDQNNKLSKEIKEKERELAQPLPVEQQFQLGTFDIGDGYQERDYGEIEEMPRQGQPLTVMPHWMLQYMNK